MERFRTEDLVRPSTTDGTYLTGQADTVNIIDQPEASIAMDLTVQNLSPQGQALQDVRILLRMVVTQPCASPTASDRKTAFRVCSLRRMEVLFQICYHPIARVPIHSQKRVVVSDAVQAL